MSNPHPSGKIILIVDGVHSGDKIIDEIIELIGLCTSGTSCSLIIACDSSNYTLMSKVPSRPSKTLFGKKAYRLELDNLNDEEFEVAKDYLNEYWSIEFNRGAQYSKELRNPRILRMLISQIPKVKNENTQVLFPSFLPFPRYDT